MLTFAGVVAGLFLLLDGSGLPGREEHIRWEVSVSRVGRRERVLSVKGAMDSGWHIYSQYLEQGGPKPTEVIFSPGRFVLKGRTLESGGERHGYDSTFMMSIKSFEDSVVFSQRIQLKGRETLQGEIRYMVCSEDMCVPGRFKWENEVE